MIVARAEKLHAADETFLETFYAGAFTGDSCDGALARAFEMHNRFLETGKMN